MLAGFHFVFRSDTSYTSWQFAWQWWVNLHLVPWLFRHVSTLSLAQDVVERVLQSLKEDVVEGEHWRQTDRQWCLRELFTVCFYFCCKDLVFFQTRKMPSFISGVFCSSGTLEHVERRASDVWHPLRWSFSWSSMVHHPIFAEFSPYFSGNQAFQSRQEACSGARPPVGCWGNPSKTSAWAGFRPRSTSTRRITGWTAVVNALFCQPKACNGGRKYGGTSDYNCIW